MGASLQRLASGHPLSLIWGGTGLLVQPDTLCPTTAAVLGTCLGSWEPCLGSSGPDHQDQPCESSWGAGRASWGDHGCVMLCPMERFGVSGANRAATLLPVGAVSRAGDVRLYLAPSGSLPGAAVRVATAPGAESRSHRVRPAPRPSCPWPGPLHTPHSPVQGGSSPGNQGTLPVPAIVPLQLQI